MNTEVSDVVPKLVLEITFSNYDKSQIHASFKKWHESYLGGRKPEFTAHNVTVPSKRVSQTT